MGLFGKKKKNIAEAGSVAEAAAGPALAESAETAANDELIAVIAAAVAAYEAEQYRQTLYIRKLNRAAGAKPAWGVMGVTEAIDMRRM